MKGQAAHHQIHKIQILQLLNIAGTLEVSRIDRLIDIKPGNMETVLTQMQKAGKIVRIDGFGTFRPTIISNGKKCPTASEYVADKSKFNPTTAIAGAKIIFTPDKALKAAVRAATCEKYIPAQENPSISKLFNPSTEE